MADLEGFRAELAAWLEANAPRAIRGLTVNPEGGGNWGGRRAVYDPPEMKRWLDDLA